MNFLVVMVVDNPDDTDAVLDAWEALGVTGVTILPSSGLGRIRKAGLRDDLPLMPSLQDLIGGDEIHHRTLLSVVDSQEKVDGMVAAVERIAGDLDEPNSGFLFVVPVVQVYGLNPRRSIE